MTSPDAICDSKLEPGGLMPFVAINVPTFSCIVLPLCAIAIRSPADDTGWRREHRCYLVLRPALAKTDDTPVLG
jgi:hypothetical protein